MSLSNNQFFTTHHQFDAPQSSCSTKRRFLEQNLFTFLAFRTTNQFGFYPIHGDGIRQSLILVLTQGEEKKGQNIKTNTWGQ